MRLRKPFSVSEDSKYVMFFCLAELTKRQANQLRSLQDIAFVIQDSKIALDKPIIDWGENSANELANGKLDDSLENSRYLEKRDPIQIQPNPPSDLVSLSKAPISCSTGKYLYFSEAGEGITVYLIDK